MLGIIIGYDERKRYGYIQYADSVNEVYFHASNCVKGFKPDLGVEVEFQLGKPFKMGKPDQAINVRPVGQIGGTQVEGEGRVQS